MKRACKALLVRKRRRTGHGSEHNIEINFKNVGVNLWLESCDSGSGRVVGCFDHVNLGCWIRVFTAIKIYIIVLWIMTPGSFVCCIRVQEEHAVRIFRTCVFVILETAHYHEPQDRNTILKSWIPWKVGNFLTSRGSISEGLCFGELVLFRGKVVKKSTQKPVVGGPSECSSREQCSLG